MTRRWLVLGWGLVACNGPVKLGEVDGARGGGAADATQPVGGAGGVTQVMGGAGGVTQVMGGAGAADAAGGVAPGGASATGGTATGGIATGGAWTGGVAPTGGLTQVSGGAGGVTQASGGAGGVTQAMGGAGGAAPTPPLDGTFDRITYVWYGSPMVMPPLPESTCSPRYPSTIVMDRIAGTISWDYCAQVSLGMWQVFTGSRALEAGQTTGISDGLRELQFVPCEGTWGCDGWVQKFDVTVGSAVYLYVQDYSSCRPASPETVGRSCISNLGALPNTLKSLATGGAGGAGGAATGGIGTGGASTGGVAPTGGTPASGGWTGAGGANVNVHDCPLLVTEPPPTLPCIGCDPLPAGSTDGCGSPNCDSYDDKGPVRYPVGCLAVVGPPSPYYPNEYRSATCNGSQWVCPL